MKSSQTQSFGAIISLIGIVGEIYIIQNQTINYKDDKGEIDDDRFTKTRYFYMAQWNLNSNK